MPAIMRFFMHPVPMVTPESSPDATDRVDYQPRGGTKRRWLTVELSSGSTDRPATTAALTVPIENDQATVERQMSLHGGDGDSNTTEATCLKSTDSPYLLLGATGSRQWGSPSPTTGTSGDSGAAMR